jgi:hypothetical protein
VRPVYSRVAVLIITAASFLLGFSFGQTWGLPHGPAAPRVTEEVVQDTGGEKIEEVTLFKADDGDWSIRLKVSRPADPKDGDKAKDAGGQGRQGSSEDTVRPWPWTSWLEAFAQWPSINQLIFSSAALLSLILILVLFGWFVLQLATAFRRPPAPNLVELDRLLAQVRRKVNEPAPRQITHEPEDEADRVDDFKRRRKPDG